MLLFYDFYNFYAAGVLLNSGQNPYDRLLLEGTIRSLGWDSQEFVFGFGYLPTSFWFFRLISLLPFTTSACLWAVLSILFISLMIFSCSGFFPRTQKSIPKSVILYLLSFFPIWTHLIFGQISLLLLFGFLAFMYFRKKGKVVWAGIFLSLVLIKPHLFVPLLVAIAIKSILTRDFGIIIGLLVGLGLMMLATWGCYDGILMESYNRFFQFSDRALVLRHSSIYGLLQVNQIISFGGIWMYTLGIVVGMVIGFKRDLTDSELYFFVLPLGLLLSAYLWPHDYVLLLPSFFYLLVNTDLPKLYLFVFFSLNLVSLLVFAENMQFFGPYLCWPPLLVLFYNVNRKSLEANSCVLLSKLK